MIFLWGPSANFNRNYSFLFCPNYLIYFNGDFLLDKLNEGKQDKYALQNEFGNTNANSADCFIFKPTKLYALETYRRIKKVTEVCRPRYNYIYLNYL